MSQRKSMVLVLITILLFSIVNSSIVFAEDSSQPAFAEKVAKWFFKLRVSTLKLITGKAISNGGSCDINSDCESGNCVNFICCESGKTCCSMYFHCDISEDCSNGYCIPKAAKRANGNICFSDSECESNHCENDICCSSGKTCCSSNAWCPGGYECSGNYYCVEKAPEPKVANGYICDSNEDCESGWCSGYVCCPSGKQCCTQDSHCSSQHGLSNYKCNNQYYCVEKIYASNGGACSSGSDCQSGNCVNGVCCTSGKTCCKSDSQCTSGYQCSSSNYYCAETPKKSDSSWCSSSSECSSGNCVNSVCCSAGKNCCRYDYHCPAGDACGTSYYCIDVVKKANGQYCTLNSDCESGNCKYSTCCAAGKSCCTSNSNCPSGYECSTNYYCVQIVQPVKKGNGQSCSSNSDCESGNCMNNICCASGKTCCLSSSNCGSGYECTNYYCAQKTLTANGGPCTYSTNCQSGNCQNSICCSAGKTCCSDNSDCSAGYECGLSDYCVQPAKKANGEYCSSNTDCISGNCKSNTCCEAGKTCCYSNSDCTTGYICTNYYCVQKTLAANGGSCSYGTDCQSGNCKSNVCCAAGKTCCKYDTQCSTGYKCNYDYSCIQIQKKSNGQSCSANSDCESGNCVNFICCESGKTCCASASHCAAGYKCSSYYYCIQEIITPPLPPSLPPPALPVTPTCGDGKCDEIETCYMCEKDCWKCVEICNNCQSDKYCSTGYCKTMPDSTKKCADLNEGICCNGKYTYGKCCTDADCGIGYNCKNNKCELKEKEEKQMLPSPAPVTPLLPIQQEETDIFGWATDMLGKIRGFIKAAEPVVEKLASLPPPEKEKSPEEIYLEKFEKHWVIKADPIKYWNDIYEFSSEEMKKNAEWVVTGKSIMLSKDVLDIASSFATGIGILSSASVAGELFSIGETIYGENTNEGVANAAEWTAIIGMANEGRKAMGITFASSIAAISRLSPTAATKVSSFLGKADTTGGVSASEAIGLGIVGMVIDKAVINDVSSTVKYTASEMNEQAKMAYLSDKLVFLWLKRASGDFKKEDAEKIIDLEIMFYSVQLKELAIRKQYWLHQKEDTFLGYVPLLNRIPALNKWLADKNIKDIEDIEKQVNQEIKWRIDAEKRIYE